MTVYAFENYHDFLLQVVEEHSTDRGYRTRLAEAAKVHPSYITRVLSGEMQLTPDQAAGLARFWGLRDPEREYFIWLVLKERASDATLRETAVHRLEALKKEHDQLGNALSARKVDASQEASYYLSWLYSAIHMLGTLRQPLTLAQISQRLGLPLPTVTSATKVLEHMNLVEIGKSGTVRSTQNNIHLSNESWTASLQHQNWRRFAIERAGFPGGDDVRYTGVHSLSHRDLEKLRRQIREFLIQTDRLVRPSTEETTCVLCLDLLEI